MMTTPMFNQKLLVKLLVFAFIIGSAVTTIASTGWAQSASERLKQLEAAAAESSDEPLWLEFEGKDGPGKGKHVVLISGDDEYRSEEALPMLGKILSQRHGFKCTVLFAIDPETKAITPNFQKNIPGMQAVETADVVIIGLRFRQLPDKDMKYFADYALAGKPIIGVRTSTHAFRYDKKSESKYKSFSFDDASWKGGFGQQVLGDTWVSHHGKHGKQSTRGITVDGKESSPFLKGVQDVWGPTDVYGIVHLPEDANILMRGQILEGMTAESKPLAGSKNDPMMPLVWTKSYQLESGKAGTAFCTTMGSSTDFQCEDLRRLIVNATYWGAGLEAKIPEKANVDIVGDYKPTDFGFGTFVKGLKPSDYDLK